MHDPMAQASELYIVAKHDFFEALVSRAICGATIARRYEGHIEADGCFDGGLVYMPLSKRLCSDDEELGKRDDDHRPTQGAMVGSTLRGWRPRRKRVLFGILVAYLLYLFVKYIPTDVPPVSKRIDTRFGAPGAYGESPAPVDASPRGPPPPVSETTIGHYFDGPLKFYNLASTLGFDMTFSKPSRNVLFAASSLKSAGRIIPLACDMSKQNRNNVHFAVMGRAGITIDQIKQMNGINDGECAILWHDGRPDFAPYSSNSRMELSIRAALGYIHKSMQLQVVLTDTSTHEDEFFIKAIKDKTKELGITTKELSSNAVDELQWMMKLDSASLSALNDLQIDILVHAPAESSGSLIRLLQSLGNADYFGLPYPRLTIELPQRLDVFMTNFLSSFRWPPDSSVGDSRLTLRHRINPERLSATEASIRTIESYYPANIPASHVLVLSSQAEVAPSYYHYLIFSLLEYKFSSTALSESNKLLGISLELPTHHLNDSTPFVPPLEDYLSRPSPLFLWQAPNSNAALYFGDKWAEFHSFLSNRFSVHSDSSKDSYAKLVSQKYPAWMEYLLELARARGYAMLYPSFASREASAIVTVHDDLYQSPEEFLTSKTTTSDISDLDAADAFQAGAILTAHSKNGDALGSAEANTGTAGSILPLLFPEFSPSIDSSGAFALPKLTDLRLLSFADGSLSGTEWLSQAESYAEEFALNLGGCKSNSVRTAASSWSADDLFCLSDQALGAQKERTAG